MTGLITRELTLHELSPDLLKSFNRYQEIQRCWRKEEGKWILKDNPFVEQWDANLKKEIVSADFTNCLQSGGLVWGQRSCTFPRILPRNPNTFIKT